MNEKEAALLSLIGLDTEILESEDPKELYNAYMKVEEYKSIIKKFRKEMRSQMFDVAEKVAEADEKGSHKVRFEDGTGFKKEARTRVTVDRDKAKELAEKKDLPLIQEKPVLSDNLDEQEKAFEVLKQECPTAVETEEEVDEIELEEAFMNGEITEEEFEEIVNRKVNYALRKYT